MSRNFELLNQAGLGAILKPAPLASIEKVAAPPQLSPSTPALDVAGPAREEIAKLVTSLFVLPGVSAPQQIVFVGSETGAGCSWMCAQVGEVLASQVTGSVCVVDCNMRSPDLHQQFAVDNHFGLSDALLDSNPIEQYVQQLCRKNLWLLSCGSASGAWREAMASSKMDARIKELRSQFDYVLIDAAHLPTYNDAVVLGSLCDGVILVLKANSTRRESAQKAVQQLKAANVPILGAVLNQRTFPVPDRIYNWF